MSLSLNHLPRIKMTKNSTVQESYQQNSISHSHTNKWLSLEKNPNLYYIIIPNPMEDDDTSEYNRFYRLHASARKSN